ncbi:hypothetical protein chiPu_0024822 [Chiloscyllium punctatum]|uniref:Uncharacterized protein n=1 Tax=Chiloscyllium punctatum TaxID=137246 RepID=A0A401TDJ0_CHIPU|nr:hypothetical protein [Chiloscyllium punctatum]
MLMEFFDESLILLKELLCWELEDIVYFQQNSRAPGLVRPLGPELEGLALGWNHLDTRLYRHFNRSFWLKVDRFGRSRMRWELAELKWLNQRMAKACLDGQGPLEASRIHQASHRPWQPVGSRGIVGYQLREGVDQAHRDLCDSMLTPELQYLARLGVNLWRVRLWAWLRDLVDW